MRVQAQIEVSAPASAVWATITDASRYLHLMSGFTRWEAMTDGPMGMGSRYRVSMRVGSAEIGGLVEVIEFDEPRDIAVVSVMGIDQRTRWRLRERTLGRTRVELRMSYGVAGSGPLGWAAERIAAPTVRGHLRRSLQQLKRQVEHDQQRAAAAARRGATATA